MGMLDSVTPLDELKPTHIFLKTSLVYILLGHCTVWLKGFEARAGRLYGGGRQPEWATPQPREGVLVETAAAFSNKNNGGRGTRALTSSDNNQPADPTDHNSTR